VVLSFHVGVGVLIRDPERNVDFAIGPEIVAV